VVGKKAIEINSYHKIKNKQNSCMYEMMITLRGFTFVSGFVSPVNISLGHSED
jgi:hypothetical protein